MKSGEKWSSFFKQYSGFSRKRWLMAKEQGCISELASGWEPEALQSAPEHLHVNRRSRALED